MINSQFTKYLALMTGSAVMLLGNIAAADAFTVFTNRTAWEAAIAGQPIITDTFDNPIASAQTVFFDSGIKSTNSADYTLPDAFDDNSASIVNPGLYLNATQAAGAPLPRNASETITWTFPFATNAFGADFLRASDGRLTLTGNFDGTGDQTLIVFTTIGGSDGFLGVLGNSQFNTISFGNANTTTYQFDSFDIDTASYAAPEPFTILGSSTAVILGALFKRKVKKS
jgi:hypothetical protein